MTTIELPPLQSLIELIGEYGLARTDGVNDVERIHLWLLLLSGIKEYATIAIEQDRARMGNAKARYNACGGDEEVDPLERLRAFCSFAMRGQDWLDVEPFFDAIEQDRARRGEPVAWLSENQLSGGLQVVSKQALNAFPVYASPQPSIDPAETERLRAQVAEGRELLQEARDWIGAECDVCDSIDAYLAKTK